MSLYCFVFFSLSCLIEISSWDWSIYMSMICLRFIYFRKSFSVWFTVGRTSWVWVFRCMSAHWKRKNERWNQITFRQTFNSLLFVVHTCSLMSSLRESKWKHIALWGDFSVNLTRLLQTCNGNWLFAFFLSLALCQSEMQLSSSQDHKRQWKRLLLTKVRHPILSELKSRSTSRSTSYAFTQLTPRASI